MSTPESVTQAHENAQSMFEEDYRKYRRQLKAAMLYRLSEIGNACISRARELKPDQSKPLEMQMDFETDRIGYYDMALRSYLSILGVLDGKD